MDLKEFNIFSANMEKELIAKMDKTAKLYNSGESDLSKYDRTTLKVSSGGGVSFVGETAEGIIELCNAFIEEKNSHLLVESGNSYYDLTGYDDGEVEEDMYFRFYEPKIINQSVIAFAVLDEFIEVLRPKTIRNSRRIRPIGDLFERYKQGAISFEVLQKITHNLTEV